MNSHPSMLYLLMFSTNKMLAPPFKVAIFHYLYTLLILCLHATGSGHLYILQQLFFTVFTYHICTCPDLWLHDFGYLPLYILYFLFMNNSFYSSISSLNLAQGIILLCITDNSLIQVGIKLKFYTADFTSTSQLDYYTSSTDLYHSIEDVITSLLPSGFFTALMMKFPPLHCHLAIALANSNPDSLLSDKELHQQMQLLLFCVH